MRFTCICSITNLRRSKSETNIFLTTQQNFDYCQFVNTELYAVPFL